MHTQQCTTCGKNFVPKFSFQKVDANGTLTFYCSISCRNPVLNTKESKICSVCSKLTPITKINQIYSVNGATYYFCDTTCRAQFLAKKEEPKEKFPSTKSARKIAILNKKGGTGKTTTALNLAASLSIKGYKTLLVDTDSQGNIAASLGLKWPRTLGHFLADGIQFESCIVSKAPNWDIMLSDEDIAHVELNLATVKEREFVLKKKFEKISPRYDFIIFDCAPSHSLMNKNTLLFVEELIITVSCDYLSVVGLNQVLKYIKHIKDLYKHNIKILGILPTFYDIRNNIANRVIELLRSNFNGKVLDPIRINTTLREAPLYKKTIFEHDQLSRGAEDYHNLTAHVIRKA